MEAEGAITVGSEGEEAGVRPRRGRKPNAWARRNEGDQDSPDTTSLSPKKRAGSTSRATIAIGARTRKRGEQVQDEETARQTLQEQIREQTGILKVLLEAWTKQEAHNKAIQAELSQVKDELHAVKEECQSVRDELARTKEQMADAIAALTPGQGSPRPSYADVARTPPTSQPSNVRTLSSNYTAPSTMSNTLYCTIDNSRVEDQANDQISAGAIRTMVETGLRAELANSSWRCRAVTKDPKNPHRIRIACRDEGEHKAVKRLVEANLTRGARILGDDLYPIRVDSVNRTAVLDETGNVRTGAAEAFGTENDAQIAKVAWLSNRDVSKAYGSMVVYLNKRADAQRLLQEGFFYAGGESGYTKAFERRERPKQCYNCQEITSHKAHQCTKPQVCGRCAKQGHHHGACTESIPKCIPCGGPHESFSKHCRKLYPAQHE